MVCGKGKPPLTFTVNGEEVKPVGTFDLLGVTFDRHFTVRPYLHSLAREARFQPAASPDWHNTSHVANCYGSSGVCY
jgi:hypothetical protein